MSYHRFCIIKIHESLKPKNL